MTSLTRVLLLLILIPAASFAQPAAPLATARPEPRFLLRMVAPLHPPVPIHEQLLVFHPRDGGVVDGPAIHGTLEAPAGDWVRTLPGGTMRIDVRLSLRLDDGSVALMTYGGVLAKPDAASWKRFLAGDKIEAPRWHYVIAPTFETSSKKYAWLNDVQAIGKLVSIQTGAQAHVAFDVYDIR